MTVIGKNSHALFFNGVSDSVVCPLANFTSSSLEVPVTATETARSSFPVLGDRDELSSVFNIIGIINIICLACNSRCDYMC